MRPQLARCPQRDDKLNQLGWVDDQITGLDRPACDHYNNRRALGRRAGRDGAVAAMTGSDQAVAGAGRLEGPVNWRLLGAHF
jgi:hypothetical protein